MTISDSVTIIGFGAFENCTSLSSVTIPNSVTMIDDQAFSGCTSLKYVFINSGSGILQLGKRYTGFSYNSFFCDCPLDTVFLGRNLLYFTDGPFRGNKTLASVTINMSVTRIDDDTFSGCTNLKSVIIRSGSATLKVGKKSDGRYNTEHALFYDCPLETLFLGRDLTYEYKPFIGNKTLSSLTIGGFVTTIDDNAFSGCTHLNSVSIGRSVTTIGDAAFYDCTSLKSITSWPTTAPSAFEGTFSNATYLNATLYVPIGSLASYQSSDCWKNFLIEEIGVTGVDAVKTDSEAVELARYSLDGKKLLTPEKGLNIIKLSDGTTRKVLVK